MLNLSTSILANFEQTPNSMIVYNVYIVYNVVLVILPFFQSVILTLNLQVLIIVPVVCALGKELNIPMNFKI